MEECGEGRVAYIVGRLSDSQAPDSERWKSKKEDLYTSEIRSEMLMGLAKCKTFEYFLLRGIRTKCRLLTASGLQLNRVQHLTDDYKKAMADQMPLNSAPSKILLDNYTNLFRRCLM